MTIVSTHSVAPSHLGQFLANVKAKISAAGLSVPVQIGSSYEEANQGVPPKVTFIPETGAGRLAPPISMGPSIASHYHSCSVIVRAKPGQQEEGRFDNVYALLDQVVGIIGSTGVGRIEWGQVTDASVSKAGDIHGVGLRFAFTYRRDIPHFDRIWEIPPGEVGTEREISTALELSGVTPPGVRVPDEALEIAAVITPTVTPEE